MVSNAEWSISLALSLSSLYRMRIVDRRRFQEIQQDQLTSIFFMLRSDGVARAVIFLRWMFR